MKISTKLSAIILWIILSTGMLMFLTISSLDNISGVIDEHQTKNTPLMITTLSLQKDIIQIQQWLTDISATRAMPGFDDGFDEAAKFYESAKGHIDTIEELGAEVKTINAISESLDDYYQLGIEMANAYINDGTDVGNSYMENFDPYAVKMEESVDVLLKQANNDFNNGNTNIESSINKLYRRSIVIFGVVIINSIFIFITIQKLVIRKLRMLTNILKDISEGEGDLTKRVKVKSKDEFGTMAKYFNIFIDTVHNIVLSVMDLSKEVVQSSDQLADNLHQSAAATEELSHSIDEVAKNAINQAQITTEGSARLITLGIIIEENESNVEKLMTASKNVNELIKQGLIAIDRLSVTTKEGNSASNSVYDNIMKTNESSNKISEASSLITSIAEQTKLLALNAAIEAARAGENGKGFSVVAEEIKNLSIQSTDSTKIIDDMVKTLQENSSTAVKTMLEVKNIYNEQIENVSLTESKYKEIAEALEDSNSAVLIITKSGKLLEQNKNEVLGTMQILSAVADENSAGTEEASASIQQQTASTEEIANASKNLSQMFTELQEVIGRFKV